MGWGARCVAVAVVVSATLSITVAASPIASATGTATLETVFLTADNIDACPHYELHYTSGAEANNLTIGGDIQVQHDDGYELYCPYTSATVAVEDTSTNIAAVGPGCEAAMSVGTCSAEVIDKAVITTGAGDDSIRVGSLPANVTVIWAGAGNDTIRALNGSRDIIHCGDGHDQVIADATDQISSDCEVVQFHD